MSAKFSEPTEHLSDCSRNVVSVLTLLAVGAPAVILGSWIHSNPDCAADYADHPHVAALCEAGLNRPLLFVNVVMLANMCGLFWLASLVQGSCWLIDAYWTIVPVLLAAFYKWHPHAVNASNSADVLDPATWRSNATFLLLLVWSARLTHSYLRREQWVLGKREDWRFADMRRRLGAGPWAVVSFFYAYLSQQPLLFGISLPFYVVNLHGDHLPHPLSAAATWTLPLPEALQGLVQAVLSLLPLPGGMSLSAPTALPLPMDLCILAAAAAGIAIAARADAELFEFVEANVGRGYMGLPPVPVLDSGLWGLSRHPNYFGEALWWGALAVGYGCLMPSLPVGAADAADNHCWIVGGWAVNTMVMLVSIQMIEARMTDAATRGAEKAARYRCYQEYTAALVPWWSSRATYMAAEELEQKLRKRA